jgi:hypothetical protein
MCLQVPLDAFTPGVLADDESGRPIPTVNLVAMAALVVLAGRLPAHA